MGNEMTSGYEEMTKVVAALMSDVTTIGGTDGDLRSLLKDSGKLRRVSNAIVERGFQICKKDYPVEVVYTMPSYRALRSFVPFPAIEPKEYKAIETSDRCKCVSTQTRIVTVKIVKVKGKMSKEEVYVWLQENGLRPVLCEETLYFIREYVLRRRDQDIFYFESFGSTAKIEGLNQSLLGYVHSDGFAFSLSEGDGIEETGYLKRPFLAAVID